MPPPGWRPGHGFPPPGPFPFPFPVFPPNTQAGSPGPPPFFPPYVFPPFMLPPPPSTTELGLKQPEEGSMLTAADSGNDSGSKKEVTEKIERNDHEQWNTGGDLSCSNTKEDEILLQSVETEFPGSIFSTA